MKERSSIRGHARQSRQSDDGKIKRNYKYMEKFFLKFLFAAASFRSFFCFCFCFFSLGLYFHRTFPYGGGHFLLLFFESWVLQHGLEQLGSSQAVCKREVSFLGIFLEKQEKKREEKRRENVIFSIVRERTGAKTRERRRETSLRPRNPFRKQNT